MAPSVSPLNWTGNKSCIFETISGFMPEHSTYIEPCMGSAEVFMRKKPVQKEYINDFNGDLVNFFRVVQSSPHVHQLIGRLYCSAPCEPLFKRNQKLLEETPNILDESIEFVRQCIELTDADVERAAAVIETQMYSFMSTGQSFALAKKDITTKFAKLLSACDRLRDAIILHRDYKDVINYAACPGAFILLDPPYVGTEDMYQKSRFDGSEHAKLFAYMNDIHVKFHGSCKFLITYNNDAHIRALADQYGFYTHVQPRPHCMAQGGKKKASPGKAKDKTQDEEGKETEATADDGKTDESLRQINPEESDKEKKVFEELLIANYDLRRQANKNHFYYPGNCEQLQLTQYDPNPD